MPPPDAVKQPEFAVFVTADIPAGSVVYIEDGVLMVDRIEPSEGEDAAA